MPTAISTSPVLLSLSARAKVSFDQYEEITSTAVPLRFFRSGANYRLLGFVPFRLHLFGAPGARIYLLGSDAYGRDQLSRVLYGGQVSLLAGYSARESLFFSAR